MRARKGKAPSGEAAGKDFTIVLAGEAGQGVNSIESIVVDLLKKSGFNVFASKEYMSRVRGGSNSTSIRVGGRKLKAHVDRIDLLVALDKESIAHLKKHLGAKSSILGDKTVLEAEGALDVPLSKIAAELGNPLFSSVVAAGAICGILKIEKELMLSEVKAKFQAKGEALANGNAEAARKGYDAGLELAASGKVKAQIEKAPAGNGMLLSGAEAIALGALAGGCNAAFAYPMTPGTSVFAAMAAYSKKLDIAVEQVEDEIGVVNMAIGAWYAGARAIVSTSGGGFALMTEGVSLAGMMESPAVIHLAQRPGPATGLPTRTEQGDLNLALYAGHGYFPRIILAPGSIEEAFELSAQAFNLADKFQAPVFILSDQHFTDSYYNAPDLKADAVKPESQIVKTSADYKRYALTKDGISPRGVPGFGSGLVAADSDEHDEEGRITEDLDGVRMDMVRKRMRKAKAIEKAAFKPVLTGPKSCKTLVVSWGSNFNVIVEAMEIVGDSSLAFLHFPQVYPLPASTAACLKKAQRLICVEGNETGQFADLIKLSTGIDIKERILKFNGSPFSVEELAKEFKRRLRNG